MFCFVVGWFMGLVFCLFLKAKVSFALLQNPVRVAVILGGLFQHDYKDEVYISLFLTSLFRSISNIPEKTKSTVLSQKLTFLYISLLHATAPMLLQ